MTRNEADLKYSPVPALSPQAFLVRVNGGERLAQGCDAWAGGARRKAGGAVSAKERYIALVDLDAGKRLPAAATRPGQSVGTGHLCRSCWEL